VTDSEFQAALVKLSPKIQSSLATPNGAGISAVLGSIAISLTGASDLSAALAVLTTDQSKLSALEASVAARVAAFPQPAAAPAPAPALTPAPGPAPAAATARPVRGLMWVAPVVSFAIIAGFFSMLTILLWDEHHPPAPPAAFLTVNPAGGVAAPAATAAAGSAEPAGGTAPAKVSPAVTVAPAGSTPNPNSLQNVLFTLLGALGAAFTQVVNFWLGSSKGSSDKTDLLVAATPAK